MISEAIAAFVGAFSALAVLAEITASNKIIRYLAAFVCGILVTVLLAWFLGWVAGVFAQIRH
jgi:hypothetical protein